MTSRKLPAGHLEGLVKSLEDEVTTLRESFERGLDARNSGRRVAELDAWKVVRSSAARLSTMAADLVEEVIDRES